jgi:hypothetical protein
VSGDVVALPVAAIRACIAANDYDGANALLAEHEAQLRAVFETGTEAEKGCRQAWLELLTAQRGLIEELRNARDDAARALDRAGHERRAVNAYLQDAG